MKSFKNKIIQWLLMPAFLLILFTPPATSQAGITIDQAQTENNFPKRLTFSLTAHSNAGNITTARLTLRTEQQFSSESLLRITVPVTPSAQVSLKHDWVMPGLPPSAPIVYFWELGDDAGNSVRTQDILIRYDDVRYDWSILENDDVAVWWHDRRQRFGDRVFEIANEAIAKQRELFAAELSYQIRIIIYNDFAEFQDWQPNAAEWVGGQAFPDYGVTVEIVSGFSLQEQWLNEVVPHEIAHLYFAQVTYNITAPAPTWLNEGVAQFTENADHDDEIQRALNAGNAGDLISLSSLENGFGQHNTERVRLAYDESVSAVIYLVETYGDEGLANLLAAYKSGLITDDAFEDVLGVSYGEFESGWAEWLGLPEGIHATPTPWPFPTFPASPTPRVFANTSATPEAVAEKGVEEIEEMPATLTPSPPKPTIVPSVTPPIQVVQVEETNTIPLESPINDNFEVGEWAIILGFLTCCCLLILLAGGGLLWVGLRKRKSQITENLS